MSTKAVRGKLYPLRDVPDAPWVQECFPPKIIQGEISFTFDFNEEFEIHFLHKLFNLIIDTYGQHAERFMVCFFSAEFCGTPWGAVVYLATDTLMIDLLMLLLMLN